ncbi:MAG: hypothetical protein H0V90_04100 [Blastocatellia bacterium]|nr:hypothetical protein [Blastocatellia bacterium]
MSLKQCEKCGEMVDEAKAFCPGCSNPFVSEMQRTETSEFELSGSTIEFSKTAYNLLLSDMGLNISEPADVNKPAEDLVPEPERDIQKQPSAGLVKWIAFGGAVVLFLLLLAAALIFFVS